MNKRDASTTTEPKYSWVKLLGFKAGMRYFRDTLTDQVAAADNSGRYPDLTDDGVLWLDTTRAVTVELGSREYSRVTVPVKSVHGQGRGYYCGEEISHLSQFLPLWTSLGGKVELLGDVQSQVLVDLLAVVQRPLQRRCGACDHFLPPGMVTGCHLIKHPSGAEIPCFGPEEAGKAKGAKLPALEAIGLYDGAAPKIDTSTLTPPPPVERLPCPACGRTTITVFTRQCSACGSVAAGALAQGGSQPEPTLLPLPLDVRDIALLRAALVAYERTVQRALGLTDGDRKQEMAPVEDMRRRLTRAQEAVDAAIIATVVEGK